MKQELKESAEIEEVLRLFEYKAQEAVRQAGIKQVNHIPHGFEFGYKGRKIEIKIKIK